MNKFKRIFDKKVNKYGQSAILHKYTPGERCPCYDKDTGYCDPQWHRDHPNAPACNEEGYLEGTSEQVNLKAFIFPVDNLNKATVDEVVLASLGQLSKDDYIYVGKSDVDIFNLNDTDYLEYDNRRWKIKSPDNYKIGDGNIAFVTKLELLGNV
ncbi:hypothetical protein [Crassaminicella profunda]|uniref:hypothetical protein n=1 Tax=Crassaminicella profunda TaxID=1286698 RepID=UPI001CA65DD8|nr:hypothetical protein [Crassaminicella profunda]QZY56705.1 hypothetical protein K7H06_07230 [Crassaminicella profunda]